MYPLFRMHYGCVLQIYYLSPPRTRYQIVLIPPIVLKFLNGLSDKMSMYRKNILLAICFTSLLTVVTASDDVTYQEWNNFKVSIYTCTVHMRVSNIIVHTYIQNLRPPKPHVYLTTPLATILSYTFFFVYISVQVKEAKQVYQERGVVFVYPTGRHS